MHRQLGAIAIGLIAAQASCGGGGGGGSTSTPTATPTITASPTNPTLDQVCSFLQGAADVKDAADRIGALGDDEDIFGSSLEYVVVSAVKYDCQGLLTAALGTIQDLFGTSPAVRAVTPLTSVQALVRNLSLGQADTSGVSDLTITNVASEVCQDLAGTRNSDSITDIEDGMPGAGLSALPAANQIMSLALQQCGSQINDIQADGLLQSIVGYLTANQASLNSPPILFHVSGTFQAESDDLNLSWLVFHQNEIASYAAWFSRDNGATWTELMPPPNGSPFQIHITPITDDYLFGLRAIDVRGNKSEWAFLRWCPNTCP